jgi:hypothetical protein
MGPGRQLWHNAPVKSVNILGVDDVTEDPVAVPDNGGRGLVAAGFDAE